MYEIILHPQEESTNAKFNGKLIMTSGFQTAFHPMAPVVAIDSLKKVINERVSNETGADYLQVLDYKGTRYWMIDDGSYVTFLLPEEY